MAWAIAAFLGGLVVKDYLPGYFRKKAENLATKEDIAGITEEVERVRLDYSAALERLRVDLQREQHASGKMLAWCVDMTHALHNYLSTFCVLQAAHAQGSAQIDSPRIGQICRVVAT